jgi:hypothetical protein
MAKTHGYTIDPFLLWARVLTAWVGRKVASISIARTAKHFRRDTSTMARNVSRLEERMRTEKDARRLCESLIQRLSLSEVPSYKTDPYQPKTDPYQPD